MVPGLMHGFTEQKNLGTRQNRVTWQADSLLLQQTAIFQVWCCTDRRLAGNFNYEDTIFSGIITKI